jgi:hypothetical protein
MRRILAGSEWKIWPKRMPSSALSRRSLARRHERSKPLVLALEAWLREQRDRVSAKSEIAKAINYSLNRWTSFTRFLDDGRICIS